MTYDYFSSDHATIEGFTFEKLEKYLKHHYIHKGGKSFDYFINKIVTDIKYVDHYLCREYLRVTKTQEAFVISKILTELEEELENQAYNLLESTIRTNPKVNTKMLLNGFYGNFKSINKSIVESRLSEMKYKPFQAVTMGVNYIKIEGLNIHGLKKCLIASYKRIGLGKFYSFEKFVEIISKRSMHRLYFVANEYLRLNRLSYACELKAELEEVERALEEQCRGDIEKLLKTKQYDQALQRVNAFYEEAIEDGECVLFSKNLIDMDINRQKSK